MEIYRVQARNGDGDLRHSRIYKQRVSAILRAKRWRAQGYAVSVDSGTVILTPFDERSGSTVG